MMYDNQIDLEFVQVMGKLLRYEQNETCVSSHAESYFRDYCKDSWEDMKVGFNSLEYLFKKYYHGGGSDINILVGILHLVSHFSYYEAYSNGQYMAFLGLRHPNSEVNDFAIKCFENWGKADGVKYLSSVSFESSWLEEYRRMVIQELNDIGNH